MVNGIVAVDKLFAIGKDGKMPWPHLSYDLKHFKKITKNTVTVMGSKTWHSLPVKPLRDRVNVVISTKGPDSFKGADEVFNLNVITPNLLVEHLQKKYNKPVSVIGGSTVYNQLLDVIDCWYVTHINEAYKDCDTHFEELAKVLLQCKHQELVSNSIENGTEYSIIKYVR